MKLAQKDTSPQDPQLIGTQADTLSKIKADLEKEIDKQKMLCCCEKTLGDCRYCIKKYIKEAELKGIQTAEKLKNEEFADWLQFLAEDATNLNRTWFEHGNLILDKIKELRGQK